MGIDGSESNRFNWKTTMGFLLIALNFLSAIILIFTLENDDLMGYVNGFVSASTLFEMVVSFTVFVLQQRKLFKIIEITEWLIKKSSLFWTD